MNKGKVKFLYTHAIIITSVLLRVLFAESFEFIELKRRQTGRFMRSLGGLFLSSDSYSTALKLTNKIDYWEF